jgi:hypothetical protein
MQGLRNKIKANLRGIPDRILDDHGNPIESIEEVT